MKIFFDTEFTGLHKDTTLISIGMISQDGRSFYAEFTDYDRNQCDDWIKENVIKHLKFTASSDDQDNYFVAKRHEKNVVPNDLYDGYSVELQGDRLQIKEALMLWLHQFATVEFVSDVCHYDMVLLIDIFGGAFDLPENVCPDCYNINQDIARVYRVPAREAFDISREEILLDDNVHVEGDKHNSLYDAKVIREMWKILINAINVTG